MKASNPYFHPISKLIKKNNFKLTDNDFWYIILHNLINQSNHTTELESILEKSPFSTEKNKEIIKSDPQFSLDESYSSTHLTPFHLSLYQFHNDSKSIGQFFTPKVISDFIVSNSLKYRAQKLSEERKSLCLLDFKYADIACGTGNLLIPLLSKLYEHHMKGEKDNQHNFSEIISKNIFCFDLDPLAILISKLRTLLFISNKFPR